MAVLKVKIQSIEDAAQGIPAIYPDITSPDQVVQHPDVTAVIMEGGMQSGATSIMFVLRGGGDNTPQYGEISGKLLETLYMAYKGAQARWGQPIDGA